MWPHQVPDCSEDRMPYLVRLIKPNLIVISRLARSTLLSKIRESTPPERRPFWIEAQAVTPRCPRTYALRRSSPLKSGYRRFCANFLKLSNFNPYVKVNRC